MSVPYIDRVELSPHARVDRTCFPGSLSFVRELRLEFCSPVTFLVGENGSGKSTLLEAIAVLAGFPISGGGTNESGAQYGLNEESALAEMLRLVSNCRARDGYFFRAELQAHFATLLEQRERDPEFVDGNGTPADPFARYGGRSLHRLSHGEAFLAVMQNWFQDGLFLLDEPESALSPQRQLTLLALMADRCRSGRTQFVIATHSPILMTYPGASIVSFDGQNLQHVTLQDTTHYRITNGILSRPEAYWRHLQQPADDGDRPQPS